MLHSVALIIVDIVKSRTIHAKLREEIGSKADTQYTRTIYAPFRQRVDELLKSHDGRIDNDTGDQVAAFFDHAHDAIAFALALQRRMLAEPIAVPDGCGSPRLQLHIAVGYGTMDPEAYQKPGTVRVGAFNDLARILAVTADDQILVTPEARATAGKFTDITWHDWDVVLPKEQDKARVLEMLWDGRAPQRPKDMASVSSQAIALVAQNKKLQDENVSLKADLTAALERMQALADTGDPQAAAAIEQARATGDLTQLDAALDAEWARREAQLKDQFRDMLELSRQSAAVAYLHGDIDKAMLRAQTILRIAPDDLDAINLIGRIHNLRGDLPTAQKSSSSASSRLPAKTRHADRDPWAASAGSPVPAATWPEPRSCTANRWRSTAPSVA
jgi:class 3 adenylate cyclase